MFNNITLESIMVKETKNRFSPFTSSSRPQHIDVIEQTDCTICKSLFKYRNVRYINLT